MTEEILEEAALAPSELIELFKHRSATYGLLSRLYAKEVDAELLDELHDIEQSLAEQQQIRRARQNSERGV